MSKIKIDFNQIDSKSKAKIMKGSVIPRPIAWITTLNSDRSINLAPFSFFNVVSPTVFSVSFQRIDGKEKDTLKNILREKEAVIHIVDESLIKAMDLTAKELPYNKSELELTNLNLSESSKIKTPGIEEALIRFEVILEESLPIKNYEKDKIESNLVLLRVVASVLDERVYDSNKGYVLADQLNPVARLGGNDYSLLKTIPFKRSF